MREYLFFASLLLFGASAHAADKPPSDYFPRDLGTNTECKRPNLSDFEASWYASHLSAAKEPSLYKEALDQASRSTKAYRFTWLRSFHEPITVRVYEASNGDMRLTAKRLTGKGGYEPGQIGTTVQRSLSASEKDKLRKLIAEDHVMELAPADCSMGVDGAEWILESRDGGKYHFASRWSPQNGPLRQVSLFLLALTAWHISDVY